MLQLVLCWAVLCCTVVLCYAGLGLFVALRSGIKHSNFLILTKTVNTDSIVQFERGYD